MTSGPRYREWPVRAALAEHLVCTWVAEFGADGQPHTDRILPDGCMDLVWTGANLVVAGPDTRATLVEPGPPARMVGVRFWPGIAPLFLGMPASALRDQRPDARDVLGPALNPVIDALWAAPHARAARAILEGLAHDRLPGTDAPDRLVTGAVTHLRATPAARPVSALAKELGSGTRQLHRRFEAAVGYGPKIFHRIVRLRRFLALSRATQPPVSLATLAAEAGYVDQAHLTRECQRLAGAPPTRLTRAILASG